MKPAIILLAFAFEVTHAAPIKDIHFRESGRLEVRLLRTCGK
jgi:hypothetical protein